MCTTMMVLTTIALLLRHHFFNKISPQKESVEKDVPYMKSNGATETPK
ncbi:hypothetical protein OYC64_006404 [Pagothenia borchgrevinki]|uniref:Uncharacterized protein n=1 Tax=Pagothenia borchgrevinki TaxID=8213 RepID=A0ABD2GLD7_PAGBO